MKKYISKSISEGQQRNRVKKGFSKKSKKTNAYFIAGSAITAVFVILMLIGLIHTPYDPNAMNGAEKFSSPSFSHIMGTDNFGRDIFSRVLKGISLYSIASMYHISVDDIVRLNPGSKEQIRAGQALKIPQAQYSNEDGKQFHTIQAGETLYQLTLKYHVTAQAICKANPGLSAENFRIGQVIVIPAQDNTPAQTEQTAQAEPAVKKNEWRDMHKVARKETIFSISQQYGITQEELIAANPELKNGKLKKGSFLFIPYPKSQETGKTAPSSQAAPSNEELFEENSISKKQINTIKVALMLPFTSTSQDEQSRMVEFYEGFLMAIDSLKHQGVSADIYTYDTKGTTAGTNAILSQSKLKVVDNYQFHPLLVHEPFHL